jgi:U6 snRNA-associated Sm-like protein LSm6
MSLGVGAAAAPGSAKRTPTDFLKSVLGRPVIVKLNSGVSYRGILACLDGQCPASEERQAR